LNKRALMLSAAIAVVMSAPAFAAAPIDSVATTAQKTSALPNPLNITSTGGIKLSSGSVPLALDFGIRSGRIQRGQLLLLEAFGGGFTWGSALIRY